MDKAELDRIRWASRRGMLELDLLLLPFVDACLPQLPPQAQQEYRRLLECADPLLHAWLSGRQSPPPEHRAAVQRIREHAAADGEGGVSVKK